MRSNELLLSIEPRLPAAFREQWLTLLRDEVGRVARGVCEALANDPGKDFSPTQREMLKNMPTR